MSFALTDPPVYGTLDSLGPGAIQKLFHELISRTLVALLRLPRSGDDLGHKETL